MKRSYSLALAGFAATLASSTAAFAQVPLVGGQCRPAITNASQYQNCRVRIVAGSEVCRCEILPQALRRGAVVDDDREGNRNDFARFDRMGSNQAAGTLSATGTMQSGTTTGATSNAVRAGTNAPAPVTQTTSAQAAAGAPMGAGTRTNTTVRAGTVTPTDATAGTATGNPGNDMNVGRAGENPNGKGFGEGTRGRSDVVRGDTATNMTDTAKAERKAERQAEKVERKADRSEMKEQARAERAAAKAERQETTEVEETTRDQNRARRTGATAGTATGNPGNGMNVGRAGESPNGKDFGEGTRGRSDASRTITENTGGTSGSLTQTELRSIVQELRRGTTINAILDRFDISRQELRQIAQDNGIKNFGQVRSEVNQIARDLRNGVSVSTVLSRYGLTLEQLQQFAERNDLEDVLERLSAATGSTAKSATKEATKPARGSMRSMDDDSMSGSTTPSMGRSNRSGATAGTATGNPGNDMNVGRAGENPNGKGFGEGTRGRSDVDTTGSTTGSTLSSSDPSSGGNSQGGNAAQGSSDQGSGNQGNGGGQGNGGQGNNGGGQGNGGGEGGKNK